MLADQDLRLRAPHPQRLADIAGPGQRVANFRAAEGQEVVEIVRGVLCQIERFELRQVEMKFCGRLAFRGHLEHEFQAIDHACLARRLDQVGRRQ
jgi:hypothetical protein